MDRERRSTLGGLGDMAVLDGKRRQATELGQAEPDRTFEPADLAGVTELRVHGVGGTPPADMLSDPHPVQVSGDRTAGVMRADDMTVPWPTAASFDASGPMIPTRWHLEAYSWGGMTGRAMTRALWLVVLPFAMVNMAGWMAPDRERALHRAGTRLAGLCLTLLYVLFVAEIVMDFAMYQCAGSPGCATSDWWAVRDGGFASTGARRVVIGAVPLVLLVFLVQALTHRSQRNYDKWQSPTGAEGGRSNADTVVNEGLTSPDFWSGQGFAERLAKLHVFSSLVLVAGLVAAATDVLTTSVFARPLWVFCAALIGGAAALALVSRARARVVPPRGLARLGLLVVAVVGVVAWTAEPNSQNPRPLPGLLPAFDVVLLTAYLAGVAVLVSGLLSRRTPSAGSGSQPSRPDRIPGRTRFRQAFTPFAVVVTAGLLTTTVFSGTALWIANRLGTATSVGRARPGAYDIVYPQPFEALARGLPVLGLICLLAGTVMATLTWRATERARLDELHLDWSAERAGSAPDGTTSAVGRKEWEDKAQKAVRLPGASLAGLEWTIWTLGALTFAGAVAYGAFWAANMLSEGDLLGYLDTRETVDKWWLPPLGFSTWLLTFVPLGAAFVMRRALTKPSDRRLVAIAWDVSTFFPRAFHPLGPPCYAERAVPELQLRLQRLWEGDGRVLLLGHSQGAVLVTAAVASMTGFDRELSERLAVVTYGCPVRRLYGRHFPAYFDAELLDHVARSLPDGWVNYYRDTDLVGHRVRSLEEEREGWLPGPREVRLPDPATPYYTPGDQLPEVRGHGHAGYRRQGAFARQVLVTVRTLGG